MLSVSFVSGVGTAQSSENISDGERYWVGQNLTYEVENGSSNAELVRGENNTFVTELDINNSTIDVNTSTYTEDLYTLTYDNASDTETSVNFNLTQQNLSVSPSRDEVTNSSNTSINFDYESNRNDFNISVSAENVSDEDLATLYDVNESEVTDGEVVVNSGQNVNLNFTDFDAGTYNFTFNVTDTTATDSSNVNVTEMGDSNVEISASRVTTAEGDEAEFTRQCGRMPHPQGSYL